MIVLITGSREASPDMRWKAEQVVLWCLREEHSVVVGDAPGVDRFVRLACAVSQVPVTVYGAYGHIREPNLGIKWEKRVITNGSYPQRDVVMARACQMCVAIWNGRSRGTKITFEAAQKMGKRTIIREFPVVP